MSRWRLYEQARRRQLWLEATGEIAADLLLSSDISQALRLIAQRALELTASDTAVIFVPADPDATLAQVNELRVAVGVGLVADRLVDTVIPVAGSTSGAVFTDLRPRNVPGLAFDPEGLAAPLGPGLVVPLRSAQWRFGVLSLARRRGAAAYDEQEMRFTGAFAEQAALAMRGAAHQSAQRRLEILGERDRIARDLHDDVIQSLFAIGLAMQRTQRAATQPTVAVRIADHRHHLQQVVQRIRSTIFDLQPGPGQRQPVHATLHTVITEFTTHAPLRTAVRISGQLDLLPAHLARHAEATVREAVSNAVRHSQATDLTVTVNNDLVLEVTDNGVGIPAGATRSGLRNLADRAAQVGGSFTVSPTDGGGTRLTWTAPLPPHDNSMSLHDNPA